MGTRGNEGRSDSEPNSEVLFMTVYTQFSHMLYVAYDFEDQPKKGILPGLIMMFLEDL